MKPASLSANAASLTHLKKNGKWSGAFLNTWIPPKKQTSDDDGGGDSTAVEKHLISIQESYLPSWDILSELFIDDATNGH